MSRNIKEIGKELMGKSLNSFHRKTGLTQLEKNNEMQDGILNGILSQVDDAYIEKTEQSNVLHLDGSGDGVVVLDSIEGNTMVNIIKQNDYRIDNSVIYRQEKSIRIKRNSSSSRHFAYLNINNMWKENTIYTMVYIVEKNTFTKQLELNNNTGAQFDPFLDNGFKNFVINGTGVFIDKLTTKPKSEWHSTPMLYCTLPNYDETNLDQYIDFKMIVLEGDWTDKEIPPYFEGLQSSFEEKINDEGKYEIEILSQSNGNIYDGKYIQDKYITVNGIEGTSANWCATNFLEVFPNTLYTQNYPHSASTVAYCAFYDKDKNFIGVSENNVSSYITPSNCRYIRTCWRYSNTSLEGFIVQMGDVANVLEYKKLNKIKLLLDEPLRGLPNGIKDRLCLKDGKLVIERKCKQVVLNGTDLKFKGIDVRKNGLIRAYQTNGFNDCKLSDAYSTNHAISDKLSIISDVSSQNPTQEGLVVLGGTGHWRLMLVVNESFNDINGVNNYLSENPINVVYELEEPHYEEVLNEYGEPIILEGYENGTLYIDSTIVPTTTVRYTPKMQSFKTLKEVENNNIMLTNDVNDNIIPYMMDVDMMILEKEMALMSHTYKLRRTGEKDMTSMQKRTQDMLERLIKGKTLTEQECKTRVTTYLNAGKITDAQAEELMLLIDEVYA